MRPPHDEQRIGHVSKHIGAALNAANIVYDRDDFADPKLDRLTPIQVTKDGRVFGHLAGWKSEHIGRPGVKPPRGTDYRYFHQGLVPTPDGDLAVGHLTLGTGHAGAGNINAAAEHYDNTGAQVAAVRVGEDAHGIWFAGRTHPTTDDLQRQTLRRSSLSGDWRKVNGQYELVAALAVNVPGFPIPRTESLVASGDDTMLVAAGMVRNGPITFEEVQAMVTAAGIDAQARVNRAIARERLRQRALPVLDEIVASARVQKRRELTASAHRIRRQQATDRYLSILAAGVDTSGRMPPELHRYWTTGVGLARWADTTTPYRSLVSALQSEIADMSPEDIKGLAANLYHDVFKQWPGDKSKGGGAIAASAAPLPAERAQAWLDDPQVQALLAALPVPGADPEVVAEPVPEDVVEAEPRTDGMIALMPAESDLGVMLFEGIGETDPHLTVIYLPDGGTLDEVGRNSILSTVTRLAETRQPIIGELFARAEFNASDDTKEQCAVWLVNGVDVGRLHDDLRAALGDRVPPSEYGAFVPHITAGYNMAADRLPVGGSVQFDRVRVSFAGENVDIPLGTPTADEPLLGEVRDDVPAFGDPEAWDAVAAAGDKRKVKTQAGADKFGVSIGDVIGKGIDDAVDNANGAVDRAQADAANLGKSVAEALFGKRPEPKDAPPPAESAPAAPPAPEPKRAAPEAAPAKVVEAPNPSRPRAEDARTYDETDAEPIENHAGEPETSTPSDVDVRVTSDVQPRMDVGAGTDHPMAEDEAPMTGAEGGELVEFGDGVATYSDGTQTDGTVWTRSPVLPGMGYDGVTLLEDQAPLKGAEGGDLVEFDGDRGVAVYSDGTETDGKQWTRSGQAPPVTASGLSVWQVITAAGRVR
ncbi:head maturation protease [Gordonia phage Love]|uniref:Capsid maturation protease n=1 Tax=Gordonia phage Love TaxID=2762401 RepID=A0A7G8LKG6_9CAUD|nr:head maturation protease [Gordonia phage Love]QNJ57738.1 capsid maturation protease [Gordonia phage Love]